MSISGKQLELERQFVTTIGIRAYQFHNNWYQS